MTDIVLKDKCFPEIVGWQSELEAFRHDLHAHPELGFETARTCGKIAETLRGWGIENVDETTVKGGVLVLIEGSRPGATVALRADCDALPMPDKSENPWKSTVEGRCHACGHDGHSTWLMGALRYLNAHRDFPGRVLGIFQPAEEIGRGALAVIAAGVLKKYDVAEIYAAHDEVTLDKGVCGFCVGPAQASTDFFYVTVKGVGTHGARPHLGVDPVPVASEMVGAFQTIISRKVNPVEKAVLSVCSINAGSFGTPNVVPAEATLSGTVRTFNQEVRELIEREMARMAKGVAEASGCTVDFRYDRLVSSVYTDPKTTAAMCEFVKTHLGEAYAKEGFPMSMGGEDFAEYQREIPGSVIRIGVRDEKHQVSIHNPIFDFNDEVIAVGATVLAGTALDRLEALAR